ncbi:MAG: hypothetical protein AMXMBFR13_10010 [Phycisphaerae bacterium]
MMFAGRLLLACTLASILQADTQVAWEFDATAQGWDAFWVHDLAVPFVVADSVLHTTITGNDPYMTSPDISIRATDVPSVLIRMRCGVGSGLRGAVYWTTGASPAWGEDKRISFDVAGDGEWQVRRVQLGSVHPLWTGTIRRIRVDPPAPAVPSDLQIDYLRLGDWPEQVAVDFELAQGPAVPVASGYLTNPPAPTTRLLLSELRPQLIRHQFNSGYLQPVHYDAVAAMGATVQLIPGVSWWWTHPHHQQPAPGSFPGDGGDWGPWESFLESLLEQAGSLGQSYVWDIWNEPDHPGSWAPAGLDPTTSRDRFFEAWRRAHVTIRALAPGDLIVGPSVSRFEGGLFSVEEFLAYAHTHAVLPDLVSWHSSNAGEIVAQCQRIRGFINAAGIDERPISINEIVAQAEQTWPGELVQYYAAVERAGVHSAAHSCWPDPDAAAPPYANCENDSASGLLKEIGGQRLPRSTWWAARAYAKRTGLAVPVQRGETVDGVAACDVALSTGAVVLGRSGQGAGDVALALSGLSLVDRLVAGGRVHVQAMRIPHSGWDALQEPPAQIQSTYTVVDGRLDLTLPQFGSHEAYVVNLRRPRFIGDMDGDLDVDMADFGHFQACYSGPGYTQSDSACADASLDADDDVDADDFSIFQQCLTGAGKPLDPVCIR